MRQPLFNSTRLCVCGLWLLLTISGVAQTASIAESAKALYRGEAQRAEIIAAAWLKTHPRAAAARVLLARAMLAQGKFQDAYTELRKALNLDPRNVDALYYLSIVTSVLSQMEFQQLYALAPDSARVHQLLGEAALAQENQTEAEQEFLAALKNDPRFIEALTALGELKRAQSKFDEALVFYTQAAEVGPLNHDIAYGLGVCHSYQQDHAKAATAFRQAVELAPDSAAARFALGNALFQSGQTEASITELRAAVTLEPKLKQAYFFLGRAYQKLGRQAEAQAAFSRVEELTREEVEKDQGIRKPKETIAPFNAPAARSNATAKPRSSPRKP